ncbi:YraN family protein [Thermaurantiacus sp.]
MAERRALADRVAAETRGRWAEAVAALYLQLKGYRIRGRRIRRPPIEIDLLASRGDTLVVVEVKYRSTLDEAVRALRPEALRRLEQLAGQLAVEFGWSQWPRPVAANVRIDLIALAPWAWPRHIEGIRS